MSKMKKFLKSFLVFAVITVGIFAFTGCGKKENKQQNQEAYLEPLTNYFEGIKTKDINKVLKAFPDFMEMASRITSDDINDLYTQYESIYGANIKFDYSFGDPVTLDQDQIEKLKEQFKAIYTDLENFDITEGYTIPVTVTITGDGITTNQTENNENSNTTDNSQDNSNNNVEQNDMIVIKYNDNWYIM